MIKNHEDLEIILKAIEDRIRYLYLTEKEVFNTLEAAEYLGISRKQVYKLMSMRKIAFHKPNGGMAYFRKVDLLDYALQNRQKSKYELEKEATAFLSKKEVSHG